MPWTFGRMLTSETGRAQSILFLVDQGEALGLSRARLLEVAGVTEAELSDPDGRLPLTRYWDLWRYIANEIPDPDLGLELGQRVQVRDTGVVGYAMLHSGTLGSALERLVRFGKIFTQRADLSLEPSGDSWLLIQQQPPLYRGFRQVPDVRLASIISVCRQITGRDLSPSLVLFPYPRPADVGAHRRLFRCDSSFDEPCGGLAFRSGDIQLALGAADEVLAGYLDEVAALRLERLPKDGSFAERVRRVIWNHLSEGQPTVSRVASELAVSGRTLQRRLREEERSFAEVVEDLRREKAQALLQDRNLAIYEVGYLLGYSDATAFYRAFRRWHGTSPSQYRQLGSS
jgi:AraC-like DNA-binding protein